MLLSNKLQIIYILALNNLFILALKSSLVRAIRMKPIQVSTTHLTYPKLCVFDLDMCIWSPEMYELDEVPNCSGAIRGKLPCGNEGVIAVKSGFEQIRIFPDALAILREYYEGKYPGMRIAAASSADTPKAVSIGRAAMNILEVLPGVTMRQVFAKNWPEGFEGNLQIGRTPPLSSDKAATHFPILKRETSIDYSDMIFFDDCNWGDHCGNVARECPGVITQKLLEVSIEASLMHASLPISLKVSRFHIKYKSMHRFHYIRT
jgi:magnesium-dependent phosphatase 1